MVQLIVLVIALAAIGTNAALSSRIKTSLHAVELNDRLLVLAYQLNALEWQSIAEQQVSGEVTETMSSIRNEIKQILGELDRSQINIDHSPSIEESYAIYDSALDEEFNLILIGAIDQARTVDEEQVDPAFNSFIQTLIPTIAEYKTRLDQGEQLANLGFVLVVIITVTLISLLFWGFQKTQAESFAAIIEQKSTARHRDDLHLLNEMGNKLRTCLTVKEAYEVIAHYTVRLFPNVSGALYIFDPATGLFETVTNWGGSPLLLAGQTLPPDKCWALDHGQVYASEVSLTNGGPCPYIEQPNPDGYLCVPMRAHDETLGILHLRQSKSAQTLGTQPADDDVNLNRQLAETVAEHIALALANLRLQETLHYQAIRDPLTSLFNRRYMEETFKRELDRAARRNMPIGVIMFDIDYFKLFNDNFGHAAGDAVLSEMGTLLKTHVRSEDIPCRYGGDEFLVILPEASLQDTLTRARQFQSEIQNLALQYEGQMLSSVTLSVGVACFPENGGTFENLLAAADIAMYRAKKEGRNRVEVAQVSSK